MQQARPLLKYMSPIAVQRAFSEYAIDQGYAVVATARCFDKLASIELSLTRPEGIYDGYGVSAPLKKILITN